MRIGFLLLFLLWFAEPAGRSFIPSAPEHAASASALEPGEWRGRARSVINDAGQRVTTSGGRLGCPLIHFAEAIAVRVNKDELGSILKCSQPTLSALLKRYGEEFPCIQRGTNGRPYEFDPDAVVAFLAAKEADRRAAGAERDELMQQYTLPGTTPEAQSGLKPSDILALTRAQKLQRDQAKEAGFLVPTTQVRQALNAAFARLRQQMGSAIRQACRESNVPEATIRTIEARVADAQRRFVADTQRDLNADAMQDDAEPAFI